MQSEKQSDLGLSWDHSSFAQVEDPEPILGRGEAGRSKNCVDGFIQDGVFVTPESDREVWRKSPEMTSH